MGNFTQVLLGLFLAASVHAQPMSLLGVDSSTTAPVVNPPPAAAPATPATTGAGGGCGLTGDQLRDVLHPGGQKTAVIVRGGKFGIARWVGDLLRRMSQAYRGDPNVQRMLDLLARPYLSDEDDVRRRLEQVGYRVELITSAEYNERRDEMKERILGLLRSADTRVLVFFGHACSTGVMLTADGEASEHSAPGPDDLAARLAEAVRVARGQRRREGTGLELDEILAAREQAGAKLDALIIQGCQGAYDVYLKDRGAGTAERTFADCVDPRRGFFAGWVTFATYLAARTGPILDAYLCHMANLDDADARRYFMKSEPNMRMLSRLAGLDDAGEFPAGFTVAQMDADARVHMRAEDAGSMGAVEHLVRFVSAVRFGRDALADDVRTFLVAHFRYLAAQGMAPEQRGGQPPPPFPESPGAADINAQLAYHAPGILTDALEAALPGMVRVDAARVRLDGNHVRLAFDVTVRNAGDVQTAIASLRRALGPDARAGIANAVPVANTGNELAGRLSATLDGIVAALPDTLVAGRAEVDVEKVAGEGTAPNTLRPVVHGYNLAVGEVPAARRSASDAPYQIHVSVPACQSIVHGAIRRACAGDVELSVPVGPVNAYAYLRNTGRGALRAGGAAAMMSMDWRIEVIWPVAVSFWPPRVGIRESRYGHFTTDVSGEVTRAGDMALRVTPAVYVTLGAGWPFSSAYQGLINVAIDSQLRAACATPVDLLSFVPQAVRGEVEGRVRIRSVGTAEGVLSLLFEDVP